MSDGERNRSIDFADAAMAKIKSLRLPATPQNFELWYVYVSGRNAALNQALDEALARSGTLDAVESERIRRSCLSGSRLAQASEEIGDRLVGKIGGTVDIIGTAADTASEYCDTLADYGHKLQAASASVELHTIVKGLVHATGHMGQTNRTLEQRLSGSRDEIAQLQESLIAVRKESLTDSVTALPNRKHLDQALLEAVAYANIHSEPLSVLMADIDYFKRFNDHHGHLIGDEVLRLVAGILKQSVKGRDLAARYGGEEFVVVLPQTPLQSAVTVAEQIRRAVMSKELIRRSTGERLARVTISIGAATLQLGEGAQSLIERADRNLYAAKRAGRNRVDCGTTTATPMDSGRGLPEPTRLALCPTA
jgi:diguanylate cyclase